MWFPGSRSPHGWQRCARAGAAARLTPPFLGGTRRWCCWVSHFLVFSFLREFQATAGVFRGRLVIVAPVLLGLGARDV